MSKVIYHLSVEETKDSELAFELFKEEQEQNILERDLFLSAFKFFLQLYDEVKENVRNEIFHHIQKVHQSLLNQVYFCNLILKLKINNRGLSKRNPTELNNNFIMKNLNEKHIVHIDKCWGRFDKRNFGYILSKSIRSCVNKVLSRYNTLQLAYQPYNLIEEQKTVSSPVLKDLKITQTDTVEFDEKREKNLINSSSQQQNNKQLLQEIVKEINKQEIENYNNNYQSNEINEWIYSFEKSRRPISFEQFANFMATIIVENKLNFKATKVNCSNCSIF